MSMMVIVILAVIVVIGLFAVGIIVSSQKNNEGDNGMIIKPSWTIRNIYLYLVCFTTLVMMMIGVIQAFDAAYGLVYPAPVNQDIYLEKYYPTAEGSGAMTPEEKIKYEDRAKANQEFQVKNNRYNQTKRLFENGVMFFVALPLYLYHWRLIKRGTDEEKQI